MQTSRHPPSRFAARFDTNLFEQAIEMDVDLLINRLARERKIFVRDTCRSLWIETVRDNVESYAFDDGDPHHLDAELLERRIKAEINRLLREEIIDVPWTAKEKAKVVLARWWPLRAALAIRHCLLQKRLE